MLSKRMAVIHISKPYDKPSCFSSPVFDDFIQDDVRKLYDPKGNAVYKKVGEINVNDFVKSFRAGCELSSTLSRIKLLPVSEQVGYLQNNDTVYGDFTAIPSDLFDALEKVKDMNHKYPGFALRCINGESFESLVKEYFKVDKEDSAPAPAPAPALAPDSNESEVNK